VGDLSIDTAVSVDAEGRWKATLSDDWNIWGPNGGYVASICLRAAGAAIGLARPATIACHYLEVGEFDEVRLSVDVLRSTKRTAAAHVQMTQGTRRLADATVWAVSDGLEGYEWSDCEAPTVPRPEDVTAPEATGGQSPFSFARNLEQRRLIPTGGPHVAQAWMRFVPTSTFDDPWIDACRSLILLDTWAWAAAASGLSDDERGRFMGPNLDVTARFHSNASGSDWLLVDARAPVAGGGLIGSEVSVWTLDGVLAASAGAQLICRPGPAYK
jgi:acyl-CoA thioesterase-2